jgi:hypothetical protein
VLVHVAEIVKSGLPWDSYKEYTLENIEVYSTVQEAVLLRVNNKATISQILKKSLLP